MAPSSATEARSRSTARPSGERPSRSVSRWLSRAVTVRDISKPWPRLRPDDPRDLQFPSRRLLRPPLHVLHQLTDLFVRQMVAKRRHPWFSDRCAAILHETKEILVRPSADLREVS